MGIHAVTYIDGILQSMEAKFFQLFFECRVGFSMGRGVGRQVEEKQQSHDAGAMMGGKVMRLRLFFKTSI